jgi:hypothetical protein
MSSELISARREEVQHSVNAAKARNRRLHIGGDPKATSEYIYPNQSEDATVIMNMFYNSNIRVIVVQKKTKVGADGFMIELLRLATTHNDDDFIVNLENVRIITGMSNSSWQSDMIEKAPTVFKDKIYHHGQLSNADLSNMKDSLIIIDEIDTGDKEHQRLHRLLDESRLLDVKHLEDNNIRFVFISATPIRQLYEMFQWGHLHARYTMTIPENYIGHKEFTERGILQEFYPLTTKESAEQWIQEDIIDNYGDDYRVHIVRLNSKGKTNNEVIIRKACTRNGVVFKIHTSAERLSNDEINELFEQPLRYHIVLGVIGFYRRANLIPNKYKLRIGATHELYTKSVDVNVQIQGLPGRMTGYWKDVIEAGHKTGPYRTSIKAIQDYEASYEEPFGANSYKMNGFIKNENGKVSAGTTMLSPKNIKNLEAVDLPVVRQKGSTPIIMFDITDDEKLMFNTTDIMHIIRKYSEETVIRYNSYEPHCWKIDTPSKCEKYGLNAMTKKDAYSSPTNIIDKTKNVIMIYLHQNKLIINAWNGSANQQTL